MSELQPGEVLCIPKRRRLVHSRLKGTDGQDVLHVFYGEKEIIFDEPELLPFGDKLLETERFRAEEAMGWSAGAPFGWERVRDLLEALLEQEILRRDTESPAEPALRTCPARLGGVPEDLAPRAFSAQRDECPAITREAYGREIDLGSLEAVVPVYRVAHAALDQDGRQVGENNVGPRPLFLDLPTERKFCNYPGSRYQADKPMNVTALRQMTKRWPELLSLTEQFRKALFARLPPQDAWLRAGEVQLMTACSLATVGYVMVRGVEPVPNGHLDAGLAASFRLIDGVRLVTTEMMRDTAGAHGCERRVDARIIADYAEQYAVYHGVYGVCAGPQALIDEYLRVLLDGESAPIDVRPDLAARVGDLDAAIDYGLHGQRIEAMVRTFGASQGLLHERLRAAFQGQTPRTRLQELLEVPVDAEHYPLLRETHPLRETFELELNVNRWLYARAGAGLPERGRGGVAEVDELLVLDPVLQAASQRKLAAFLADVLPDYRCMTDRVAGELAAVAVDAFTLERRCLRAVASEQQRLNERLLRGRGRALVGDDIAIYNRPRTGPSIEGTLADGLGLSIRSDAHSTVVTCGDRSLSLAD